MSVWTQNKIISGIKLQRSGGQDLIYKAGHRNNFLTYNCIISKHNVITSYLSFKFCTFNTLLFHLLLCHGQTMTLTEVLILVLVDLTGMTSMFDSIQTHTFIIASVSARACLAKYLSLLIFSSKASGTSGTRKSINLHIPNTICWNMYMHWV